MNENKTQKQKKRRSRRGWVILGAAIALVLLVLSMLFLIDGRYVRFYMYGDGEQTIEYGSDFQDPGVYAVTTGRLFGESEEHLEVETFGKVDTGRLGTYVLRYVTRYAFSEFSTERKITVADTTRASTWLNVRSPAAPSPNGTRASSSNRHQSTRNAMMELMAYFRMHA